ncbi:hypothetical protein TRVA0_036S00606 [Trichomonascus vanleenenianus]|uniref:COP9 signalosome complex subunit 6 n=1 Tax=Trichomonascus vanleenenianus TaxID=2268995 RepID=UPI003ECAFF45
MAKESLGMSQVNLTLHPLPLLNISDYYTRVTLQGKPALCGILFGTRTERLVSVENAFEILVNDEDDIDQAYMRKKIDLYKQTFPLQDAVGWFYVDPKNPSLQPNERAFSFHKQMQVQDDLDLSMMLIFNPTPKPSSTQLPVKAFELAFRDNEMDFIEVPWKAETGEVERIGVDSVIKGSDKQSSDNLASRLQIEFNAVKMFSTRLKVLREYTKAVREGKLPPNHEILRQINALMGRLVKSGDGGNQTALLKEQEINVLAASLASVVTRASQSAIGVRGKRVIVETGIKASLS